MKKNGLKSVIIVVFCACLCVGYYYYITHKTSGKEKAMTEVELVASKDLETAYPKTAREVVKFYNRILKCYYSREFNQEQLEALTRQAWILMDEELREANPQDQYLQAVIKDVSGYEKDEASITNISLADADQIEEKTVKGRKCAYVDVDYYIRGKEKKQRTSQTYILRKDDDGNWRILGFYQRS